MPMIWDLPNAIPLGGIIIIRRFMLDILCQENI